MKMYTLPEAWTQDSQVILTHTKEAALLWSHHNSEGLQRFSPGGGNGALTELIIQSLVNGPSLISSPARGTSVLQQSDEEMPYSLLWHSGRPNRGPHCHGAIRSRAETGTVAQPLCRAMLDTNHRATYTSISLTQAAWNCTLLISNSHSFWKRCISLWGQTRLKNRNIRSGQNFFPFEKLYLSVVYLSVCVTLWCFHNMGPRDQIKFSDFGTWWAITQVLAWRLPAGQGGFKFVLPTFTSGRAWGHFVRASLEGIPFPNWNESPEFFSEKPGHSTRGMPV